MRGPHSEEARRRIAEGVRRWCAEHPDEVKTSRAKSVAWHVGKKRSSESLKRMSLAHQGHLGYWKDKVLSDSHRQAMSKAQMGRKQTAELITRRIAPLRGRKRSPEAVMNARAGFMVTVSKPDYVHPLTGREFSAEHRRNLSESQRGNKKGLGHHPNAAAREQMRAARLKQVLPKRASRPERILQMFFDFIGAKYVAQYPVLLKIGKGCQIDFAFPESKIAVEVNGCYWHGCPTHYPNERWLARLAERTRELEVLGWRVINLWAHEFNQGKVA